MKKDSMMWYVWMFLLLLFAVILIGLSCLSGLRGGMVSVVVDSKTQMQAETVQGKELFSGA